MYLLASLAVGLVFGLGLIVSGMANPAKVLGFLDLAGAWDPSLALVMAGAIAVGVVGFAVADRRAHSWLGSPMRLPSNRIVDRRLVGGGLLFGIGWGIAGFCPGPALVALGAGYWQAAVFVAAMLAGMAIYELAERFVRSRRESPRVAEPKRLTQDLWVTAQPSLGDIRRYAAQGYRTIVNNRPDGEEPGQPLAAQARAEAGRVGLAYVHLPVKTGAITAGDVDAFRQALQDSPKPVLAHCRTGLRSYLLWGAGEVASGNQDAGDLARRAAAAGYDPTSLARLLARLDSPPTGAKAKG